MKTFRNSSIKGFYSLLKNEGEYKIIFNQDYFLAETLIGFIIVANLSFLGSGYWEVNGISFHGVKFVSKLRNYSRWNYNTIATI